MDVWFDYLHLGDKVVTGVLLLDEDGSALHFSYHYHDSLGDPQKMNLDYSLLAFYDALVKCDELGLDVLVLKNQNRYIFEWVRLNLTEKRPMISNIVSLLAELGGDGVVCDYEVCKASSNKVKSRLKKELGSVSEKGSFSHLARSKKSLLVESEIKF